MNNKLLFIIYLLHSFLLVTNLRSQIIINSYTATINFNPCKNSVEVKNIKNFTIGDTILIIQMQGAVIDSSNSQTFGSIKDYANSGNYEFNYIEKILDNTFILKNKLINNYDFGIGSVQLIKVPFFENYSTTNKLTCLPWDGEIGGVLVLNIKNTLSLNHEIDVTGRGFRGGIMKNSLADFSNCFENKFYYPNGTIYAAEKGESIAKIGEDKKSGKGHLATGGGGGNDHNSGGGGGGNGGKGGFGGYQYIGCDNNIFDNRGIGGSKINYSPLSKKIFLGGGGGAGHCNNGFINPNRIFNFNGANGGGLIIISAQKIINNGASINASGDDAIEVKQANGSTHDGMGGGGAGGTILLNVFEYGSAPLKINVFGGKGGDMYSIGNGEVGPGGGGGGGCVWLKQERSIINLEINNLGGKNGIIIENLSSWGAASGDTGQTIYGLVMPINNVIFNELSAAIVLDTMLLECYKYKLIANNSDTSVNLIRWHWTINNKSDSVNLSNIIVNLKPGINEIVLFIQDELGCVDSVSKSISVANFITSITQDTTVCSGSSVPLKIIGGTKFEWRPNQSLSSITTPNPIAKPDTTTKYYVQVTNQANCKHIDSITINIFPKPKFSVSVSKKIACENDTFKLIATGGNSYKWLNPEGLNNPAIPDPIGKTEKSISYKVLIISSQCNDSATLFQDVNINKLPIVNITKSNDVNCDKRYATLMATGAAKYEWSPTLELSNASISNPVVNIEKSTKFILKATSVEGCIVIDSIDVFVTNNMDPQIFLPNIFTPNGDGINDCFGPLSNKLITIEQFQIFNRWGALIFSTKNKDSCWDGKYNGTPTAAGVYTYYLKGSGICGKIFKKGSVVLIN